MMKKKKKRVGAYFLNYGGYWGVMMTTMMEVGEENSRVCI